jgi:linoleoyl-CoA desaturase
VADGLGTSSWLWRFKHNVLHHGATNIEEVDTDIAQAPFARLSPGQPWRSWHRYQHIYLWPLYGFMALKNLLIGDLRNVITRRIGPQELRRRPSWVTVTGIVVGKLLHLAVFVVVPLLFNPWWAVVAFYLCISWLVGFVLAVTFQLAHCVEGMVFADEAKPHKGQDFIPHALSTTSNIGSTLPAIGYAFRWLVGGLDHQIEHHLGARLPHTALAAVGRRFRQSCTDLGVEYREHVGLWAGVRSHARWLKQMSRP